MITYSDILCELSKHTRSIDNNSGGLAVNMINAMFEGTQQFEENDLQFMEELDEDSDDDIARAFSDAADFLESEECDVDGTVVLRLSISILALAAHNQGEEHKDTVIAPLEHLVEGV